MKNNKQVIRDECLASALSKLSLVWDNSNLNKYQSDLLYTAMSSIEKLQLDLERKDIK